MGIQGLIPFVKKASTRVNVRNLSGTSVAVDSYCWLHKGTFGCAGKLIRGEDTDLYVKYCLKYVDMLLQCHINVIMVFDGCHLPAKAETESKRREARREARLMAQECLRNNDTGKAYSYMQRAVDVTHEMALQLIKACRARGVACIVAPYEADAQMAWLNKVQLVDYVITEDSDLILFGAQKILFKLDLEGKALLVESRKLHLTMGCNPKKYTFDRFRRMCILSGCDYLDSLPGVGLKRACKFVLTTEEDDMRRALRKVSQYLNMPHLQVTEEYIENFLKAEATFRHMYIYNPLQRKMERLNDLKEFNTNEKYCSNAGSLFADERQAFQLALGNVNPLTWEQMDNWDPDVAAEADVKKTKNNKCHSIWQLKDDANPVENDLHSNIKESESENHLEYKKILYKNMCETELRESLIEEKTKLDEAEVFTLYNGSKESQHIKRRRSCDEEENANLTECGGESLPESPLKTVYNPFAKANRPVAVCNNASLLKVLSPQKLAEDGNLVQRTERLTVAATNVEVKSRFFAENHKLVNRGGSLVKRDLTLEMLEIEEQSQTRLNKQQQLYVSSPNSPEAEMDEGTKIVVGSVSPVGDCEQTCQTQQPSQHSLPQDMQSSTSSSASAITTTTDDEMNKHVSTKLSLKQYKANPGRQLGLKRSKKDQRSTMTDTQQSTLSKYFFRKRPAIQKV